MTIRTETLARQPKELLLKRLRDVDPDCVVTRNELSRRGLAREMFDAVKDNRAERFLEAAPSHLLAAEAHKMDLELGDGIV